MVKRQLVSLSRKDFDKIVAGALKNGDLTIDNKPFQMRKDILDPVSLVVQNANASSVTELSTKLLKQPLIF